MRRKPPNGGDRLLGQELVNLSPPFGGFEDSCFEP
jgi:hypothetical protein